MILSFFTKQKNGQPTYFVEKIWRGLEQLSPVYKKYSNEWLQIYYQKIDNTCDFQTNFQPKITTIREDKHDRWHAGVLIHFIVFPRSKKMFQFAPVIPCVSTQKIVIETNGYLNDYKVYVDGRELNIKEVQRVAWNDGFDNVISFLLWFRDGFEGKIIHWTDLRY